MSTKHTEISISGKNIPTSIQILSLLINLNIESRIIETLSSVENLETGRFAIENGYVIRLFTTEKKEIIQIWNSIKEYIIQSDSSINCAHIDTRDYNGCMGIWLSQNEAL